MTAPLPLRPLVVGSPRSGFALMCSVMSYLTPLQPTKIDLRQRLLNALIDAFGDYIPKRITAVFEQRGLADDLIYNRNFQKLCGGPKWLGNRGRGEACFRKYIGVRGFGDFTLITTHPRETLDYDGVVHSHADPGRWPAEPAFDDYTLFASVRNPVGIINSSLFSINALTSEYIQRFVPPEDDNDQMRQNLALYKYTDLNFFEGLVAFYKNYFDEFVPVQDKYIVMRWEDLITSPTETICRLAQSAGVAMNEAIAAQIWSRLDHVNLTGAHKHNYRRGSGRVGGWREWITNRHLDIIRDYGFDRHMASLGYDPIRNIDESNYSPFQKRADSMLRDRTVFDEFQDRELFGFAFNKSNIDASKFDFKQYDWRDATRVERADFRDEELMMAAWDAAEDATATLNEVFAMHLSGEYDTQTAAIASLSRTQDAAESLRASMPNAYEAIFPQLRAITMQSFMSPDAGGSKGHSGRIDDGEPPRLIGSIKKHNLVVFQGRYYGIPQSAGPMDIATEPVDRLHGVVIVDRFDQLIDRLSGSH